MIKDISPHPASQGNHAVLYQRECDNFAGTLFSHFDMKKNPPLGGGKSTELTGGVHQLPLHKELPPAFRATSLKEGDIICLKSFLSNSR